MEVSIFEGKNYRSDESKQKTKKPTWLLDDYARPNGLSKGESLPPLSPPPPSLNGGTKEMGYKCLGKKKREKKKSERRNNRMEVDREARKERKEGECKKKRVNEKKTIS